MAFVSDVISKLKETSSPKVNEHVVKLGTIDGAGYSLIYYSNANPKHYHPDFNGTFLVVSGTGKILLGEKYAEYKAGDVFKVERYMPHEVLPSEATVLLTILDPDPDFSTGGWNNTVYL